MDKRHKRIRSPATNVSLGKRNMETTSPAEASGGPHAMNQPEQSMPSPISSYALSPSEAGSKMPPAGKMLLPRLHRRDSVVSGKVEKQRTSHACDRCRKTKAKCSGGHPCEKCKADYRECIYGHGKREKEKREAELLKKRHSVLSQRNEILMRLLHSISQDPNVNPGTRREISEVFSALPIHIPEDENASNPDLSGGREGSVDTGDTGEDFTGADVASLGSLDSLKEDTNRDEFSRAAGYMGKSSAVRWVQSANSQTARDLEKEGYPERSDAVTLDNVLTSSCYHADDHDVSMLSSDKVNPLGMPDPQAARELVEFYFLKAHPTFPVLCEADFTDTLNLYLSRGLPQQLSDHEQDWLCMLNIVFAIGSKYEYITNPDYPGDNKDHLVFYARAQGLGLDFRTLHRDSEIQHTACLGLLGLYLLINDQINRHVNLVFLMANADLKRAWTISGLAVRHAMTLGLHVRSKAKDLSDVDKELRCRLWWALYGFERLINQLTGRPSCIANQDVSIQLPLNQDESTYRRGEALYTSQDSMTHSLPSEFRRSIATLKLSGPGSSTSKTTSTSKTSTSKTSTTKSSTSKVSSTSKIPTETSNPSLMGSPRPIFPFPVNTLSMTSSTYFIYRTQLAIVSHEILTDLYSPTLANIKWSEVQDAIRRIDRKLDTWKSSLPLELNFEAPPPLSKQDLSAYHHFSAERTGLFMFYLSSRMTLFRPTLCRLTYRIPHESSTSKSFSASAVQICISSARRIIALLPDLPSTPSSATSISRQSSRAAFHEIRPWWTTIHYLIEAASVLMLELAYRAEHVPSQAQEVLSDAKQAVAWMRAMALESVAARKGWVIYRRLLVRVADKVGGDMSDVPDFPEERVGGWDRDIEDQMLEMQRRENGELVTSSEWPTMRGHPQSPSQSQGSERFQQQQRQQQSFSTGTSLADHISSPLQHPQPHSHPQPQNYLSPLAPFIPAAEAYSRYDEWGPWSPGFYDVSAAEMGTMAMDAPIGFSSAPDMGGPMAMQWTPSMGYAGIPAEESMAAGPEHQHGQEPQYGFEGEATVGGFHFGGQN